MLVEHSQLVIKPGEEEAFAAAMRERGKPLLLAVAGVQAVSFGRGVEDPSKFALQIVWESIDAHKAYNLTEACIEFRQLVGPHASGGSMEHFEME